MRSAARTLTLAVLTFAAASPALALENVEGPRRTVVVRTQPTYPELARRMHISGDVVLLVDIQADGAVSDTHVKSGHALLRQAAEDAVRRWRFTPSPAPSVSVVTVSFDANP